MEGSSAWHNLRILTRALDTGRLMHATMTVCTHTRRLRVYMQWSCHNSAQQHQAATSCGVVQCSVLWCCCVLFGVGDFKFCRFFVLFLKSPASFYAFNPNRNIAQAKPPVLTFLTSDEYYTSAASLSRAALCSSFLVSNSATRQPRAYTTTLVEPHPSQTSAGRLPLQAGLTVRRESVAARCPVSSMIYPLLGGVAC